MRVYFLRDLTLCDGLGDTYQFKRGGIYELDNADALVLIDQGCCVQYVKLGEGK